MLSSASQIVAKQLNNKPTNLGSLGFIDGQVFVATREHELAKEKMTPPTNCEFGTSEPTGLEPLC